MLLERKSYGEKRKLANQCKGFRIQDWCDIREKQEYFFTAKCHDLMYLAFTDKLHLNVR